MPHNSALTPLQVHMAKTYFGLRSGLIALALILPLVLPLWAWTKGIEYQQSLSAYYHALGPSGESVREPFVGLLFVVGALLGLYKGYSLWEEWLLNAAGVLVVGVALIPMKWPEIAPHASQGFGEAVTMSASWHGALAVGFFLCIAAVCLFCSRKTLAEVPNPAHQAWYKRAYFCLGTLMVVAPLLAYAASALFFRNSAVILVETLSVLVFGAYWLVKTIELRQSNAERNALAGKLHLSLSLAAPDEDPQAN